MTIGTKVVKLHKDVLPKKAGTHLPLKGHMGLIKNHVSIDQRPERVP